MRSLRRREEAGLVATAGRLWLPTRSVPLPAALLWGLQHWPVASRDGRPPHPGTAHGHRTRNVPRRHPTTASRPSTGDAAPKQHEAGASLGGPGGTGSRRGLFSVLLGGTQGSVRLSKLTEV